MKKQLVIDLPVEVFEDSYLSIPYLIREHYSYSIDGSVKIDVEELNKLYNCVNDNTPYFDLAFNVSLALAFELLMNDLDYTLNDGEVGDEEFTRLDICKITDRLMPAIKKYTP